jgi:hypothetical protein
MEGRRQPWIICGLLNLILLGHGQRWISQTNGAPDQGQEPYSLRVSVNEVSLTFHVADDQGLPINDLKVDELNILDNGKAPRKILAFQLLQDFRPVKSASVYKSSPPGGKTGFPEMWFPRLRCWLQVSEKPTIRQYEWSWLGCDGDSRSCFDGASAIKTAPMITRTATPISSALATMLRHAWVPMSAA